MKRRVNAFRPRRGCLEVVESILLCEAISFLQERNEAHYLGAGYRETGAVLLLLQKCKTSTGRPCLMRAWT